MRLTPNSRKNPGKNDPAALKPPRLSPGVHVVCHAFAADTFDLSSGDGDFDYSTPGSCADVDSAVATCAYVPAAENVYTRGDCDGDGFADHLCVDAVTNERGTLLSGSGCTDNWPSAAGSEALTSAAVRSGQSREPSGRLWPE